MNKYSRNSTAIAAAVLFAAAWCPALHAQTADTLDPIPLVTNTESASRNPRKSVQTPSRSQLDGTLFVGGSYLGHRSGFVFEGFRLKQSITRRFALVGLVTGYERFTRTRQLISPEIVSPESPGQETPDTTTKSAQLNYARLEGGVDFKLIRGTHVLVLAGGDVGGSRSKVVEGYLFSSLMLPRTRRLIELIAGGFGNLHNGFTLGEMSLTTLLFRNRDYRVIAGAGGRIYSGRGINGVAGRGGPILALYVPAWRTSVWAQAGYGTLGEFGQLAVAKHFRWIE